MSSKIRNYILVVMMSGLLLGGSILNIVKKDEDFSLYERRELKQFPKMNVSTIMSGEFMRDFEDYALDQFFFRESFRCLKAITSTYLFHQQDQHGIYYDQGHLSKREYPMNISSMDKATTTFLKIYDRYLKGTNTQVYISVIPDKNYYLKSTLSMDYDAFMQRIKEKTSYMTYIDICDQLSLDDFYQSDPHWRQENIVDVAENLASNMGVEVSADYHPITLATPFYGAYSKQSALFHKADQLTYLYHEQFDQCVVFDHQNNREISIYDLEKAQGRDGYEMFLSGSLSLITIENPNANSDKELILFRDSFSSSLAPLLIVGYKKITMVDIRYIQSEMLSSWIDFDQQDVLFLYSTLVLNHGETLK